MQRPSIDNIILLFYGFVMELLAFGKEYNVERLGDVIVNHANTVFPERFEDIIDYLVDNYNNEILEKVLLLIDMLYLVDSLSSDNPSSCAGNHIITVPSRYNFIAQYENENDSYGVFADRFESLSNDGLVLNSQGFNYVPLNYNLVLLGIAIHEVRHRLQYNNRIKMFTEESQSEDSFVNNHILYYKRLCSYMNFIEGHEKVEFDAHLVQGYFLSLVAKKSTISLDTIFSCLFLEVEND